ncbi:hypothetical protein L4Z64_001172 [Pseudomonas aeruginosa]
MVEYWCPPYPHRFQQGHTVHLRSADAEGYPNPDYELFYAQGLRCYRWGLPRRYVRQALHAVANTWSSGKRSVEIWQLRAFAYGLQGYNDSRYRSCPEGYQWPEPPDASWETVICVYPNGDCDIDFAHPVSRRFWSERNGLMELPSYDKSILGSWWFEEMGFEIFHMQPTLKVQVSATASRHLSLVKAT